MAIFKKRVYMLPCYTHVKTVFCFLITLTCINTSFAQPLTTASIIILLDTSEYYEKNIPAQTQQLIQAFNQKAAPIITTSYLLNKVFKNKETILDSYEISSDSFDGWIYKKINDLFYLLIPQNYVPELKTLSPKQLTENSLTPLELKLGLKVDHLETIAEKNITLPINTVLENFVFLLNNIFVTNKEYAEAIKTSKTTVPRWAIYLTGHGGYPSLGELVVAGIPLSFFRKLLEFLESKLSVGFFFFNTCFAGGKNLEKIYQDANKLAIQKTFNFIIAEMALTEAPTFTVASTNPFTKHDAIILDYGKFFTSLQNMDGQPIDFVTTLNYVCNFLRGRQFITNIPLMKLPGLEWISPLDIPGKIVSLGKSLARSRDQSQVLDISTFFAGRYEKLSKEQKTLKKIYPDAILLYTDKIAFPLKISAPTSNAIPPALVSMISGDAVHELSEIDASEFKLSKVMRSFFPFTELQPQKIFLIKKLTCQNDPLVKGLPQTSSPRTLKNVIFYNNTTDPFNLGFSPHNGVYFTIANDYYVTKNIKYSDQDITVNQISHDYIDKWVNKMADITSKNAPNSESIFSSNLAELKKFIGQQSKPKNLPSSTIEELLHTFFEELSLLQRSF